MTTDSPCHTCQPIAARDAGNVSPWDSIHRTSYWDVAHAFDTSLPGRLALVARRHIEAIAELTDIEALGLQNRFYRDEPTIPDQSIHE